MWQAPLTSSARILLPPQDKYPNLLLALVGLILMVMAEAVVGAVEHEEVEEDEGRTIITRHISPRLLHLLVPVPITELSLEDIAEKNGETYRNPKESYLPCPGKNGNRENGCIYAKRRFKSVA
jgi:hypothetical protein